MPRYRVTTPDTPRIAGKLSADFEASQECETVVCVRHLLERHAFNGCGVWRRTRDAWMLIFDTTMPADDYSNPSAAWERTEASETGVMPYYVVKRADGRFDLRQTRYRKRFYGGKEHPHDLMATAFQAPELSTMIDKHFRGLVDKSAMSLP